MLYGAGGAPGGGGGIACLGAQLVVPSTASVKASNTILVNFLFMLVFSLLINNTLMLIVLLGSHL